MKNSFNKISVLVVGSLFSVAGFAQEFYVNSLTGYGFSLASMSISANYSPSKIESVHGSFGKGLDLGIGAGYSFSKNVSAEIDFSYLAGGKIDLKDNSNTSAPAETENLQGRMFRIIPTLKLSTGEKYKPYTKVGFVMGIGNKLIDKSVNYENTWSGNPDKIEETTTFSGGISLGLKGNVGLDVQINDKFGIYGEINFISQSWAPKKAVITSYVVNSEDKLSTLDLRDKETEFVDSYDPNTNIQPNEANKSLKIYLPFSSWGINVGVKFSFGKKE